MVKSIDKKRNLSTRLYVSAFIITVIIFVAGIGVENLMSKSRLDEAINRINDIEQKQRETSLELALINYVTEKNQTCSDILDEMKMISSDTEDLGKRIEYYESVKQTVQTELTEQKKYYTTLLLENWMFFKEYSSKCERYNPLIVLYFYSNKNCSSCKDQGYVLDWYKQKYGQSILIFSIDMDLDLTSVSMMKKLYSVQGSSEPVLVINNKRYEGFQSQAALQKILCEDFSEFCK